MTAIRLTVKGSALAVGQAAHGNASIPCLFVSLVVADQYCAMEAMDALWSQLSDAESKEWLSELYPGLRRLMNEIEENSHATT